MRDQMIEITGETPLISESERYVPQSIIPNMQGNYWMLVYPPLTFIKAPMPGARHICPWSMIDELTDDDTTRDRKEIILKALYSGELTMRLSDLPANRIMFMEETKNRKITVWVD